MDELTHQKDDVEEEKERAEGAQEGQRLKGFRHRCSLAALAFLPLSQLSRHHKRPQGHKIEKVFLARASECEWVGVMCVFFKFVSTAASSPFLLPFHCRPQRDRGRKEDSRDSRETRDLSRRCAPFSTPQSNCPTFGILTTRSRFTCGERGEDREESPLSNP